MILLDTSVLTGAGTTLGSVVHLDNMSQFAEVQLNVSAAASGAGDTLNVYVQTTVDNGATWDDLISFTQVLGNGGVKKFLARWQGTAAPTTAMAAPQDGALAAGTVVQGPKGVDWRVKAVVVNATAAAFTIKVHAAGDTYRRP